MKEIILNENELEEIGKRLATLSEKLANLERQTKLNRMETDLILSMLVFLKEKGARTE